MNNYQGIWFSRHEPTPEQRTGVDFLAVEEGKAWGATTLDTDDDVTRVVRALQDICEREKCWRIYGVFPVPIMGRFDPEGTIQCYGAWNVNRAAEGQKPTFHHKRWICIGLLR